MELLNSAGARQMHIRHRLYTYIVYLNDRIGVEDGRTQFSFGDDIISIEAKAGKLLMFPANELYTHRGETLTTGEKYLMTGWISVPATAGFVNASADDQANWQRILNEPGMKVLTDQSQTLN